MTKCKIQVFKMNFLQFIFVLVIVGIMYMFISIFILPDFQMPFFRNDTYLIKHQCDYPTNSINEPYFSTCVNFKKAGTNEFYTEEEELEIRKKLNLLVPQK